MHLESTKLIQKVLVTQKNNCFCKRNNWRQHLVNATKAVSTLTTTTTTTITTTIHPTTVFIRCIYNGRNNVQHTSNTTTKTRITSFRSIISVSDNKKEDDVKKGKCSNRIKTIKVDTQNQIDSNNNNINNSYDNNTNNDNNTDNKNNSNNNTNKNKKIVLLYDDYMKEQIQNNIMQYDPIQTRTAKALQRLQKVLFNGYTNEPFHHQQQKVEQKTLMMKTNDIETKRLQSNNNNNNNKNKQPIRMGIYDLSIGAPPPPPSKVISYLGNDHYDSNDDGTSTSTGDSDSTVNETKQQQQQQQLLLPRIPRGLYIYGSVGSGKSMLMDIFYDLVQVQSTSTSASASASASTSATTRKVRYHFHELMSILHQSLHTIKNNDNNNNNNNNNTNSIQQVGIEFSKQYTILCIDELQIIDIGDAILLYQFFTILLQMGTIIVCTSNRHPTKLYEYGMNYTYFIQTLIPLIQHHCIVLDMISTIDYRLLHNSITSSSSDTSSINNSSTTTINNNDDDNNNYNETKVRQTLPESTKSFYNYLDTFPSFFFSSSDSIISNKNCITINELIHQLRQQQQQQNSGTNESIQQSTVTIPSGYNRTVSIQNGDTNNFIAYCTFDELCGDGSNSNNSNSTYNDTLSSSSSATSTPLLLSSIDYRAIAKHFSIVCIDTIPILSIGIGSSTTNHDKARRFITLIDELYEARVALICCCTSMSTAPETTTVVRSPNDLFIDTFIIDDDNKNNSNHTSSHVTTLTSITPTTSTSNCNTNEDNNNNDVSITSIEEMNNLMSRSEIASVRELSFAIKRCTSRIIEMTSHNWWYTKAKTIKKNSSSIN